MCRTHSDKFEDFINKQWLIQNILQTLLSRSHSTLYRLREKLILILIAGLRTARFRLHAASLKSFSVVWTLDTVDSFVTLTTAGGCFSFFALLADKISFLIKFISLQYMCLPIDAVHCSRILSVTVDPFVGVSYIMWQKVFFWIRVIKIVDKAMAWEEGVGGGSASGHAALFMWTCSYSSCIQVFLLIQIYEKE